MKRRNGLHDFSIHEDSKGTKRTRLHVMQGGRCYLCSGAFTRRGNRCTDDHVTPKRMGGTRKGNILLACGPCNWEKGDRAPTACEALLCVSIYLRMPASDVEQGWHEANRFIPLRARLAMQAAE